MARFLRQHRTRIAVYGTLVLLILLGYYFRGPIRHMIRTRTLTLPPTVASVLAKYEPAVRQEFEPICAREGIAWPPARIQLLAFKEEASLEVWAADPEGAYRRIATFPILGLSGKGGPKRRSGDLQVPEGFYRLTNLNPQSSFHLSIRVDYPNEEDVRNAEVPREEMGGDIYIHGNRVSIGCLAMGDEAIEKIFCLVALSNKEDRQILISPVDFRKGAEAQADAPWVEELYARIKEALKEFPGTGF